jgi:hypothetical protein
MYLMTIGPFMQAHKVHLNDYFFQIFFPTMLGPKRVKNRMMELKKSLNISWRTARHGRFGGGGGDHGNTTSMQQLMQLCVCC